ncbi:uncharacterized protein LOC144948905 isoform X1 [Lampetra fluviatilis]
MHSALAVKPRGVCGAPPRLRRASSAQELCLGVLAACARTTATRHRHRHHHLGGSRERLQGADELGGAATAPERGSPPSIRHAGSWAGADFVRDEADGSPAPPPPPRDGDWHGAGRKGGPPPRARRAPRPARKAAVATRPQGILKHSLSDGAGSGAVSAAGGAERRLTFVGGPRADWGAPRWHSLLAFCRPVGPCRSRPLSPEADCLPFLKANPPPIIVNADNLDSPSYVSCPRRPRATANSTARITLSTRGRKRVLIPYPYPYPAAPGSQTGTRPGTGSRVSGRVRVSGTRLRPLPSSHR